MKLAIFGAKSIALGVCITIRELYPECDIVAFLVSSLKGNPSILAGIPVREIHDFDGRGIKVLIATPEDLYSEITILLEAQGFNDYICIDSRREADLMERYFERTGKFPGIHKLSCGDEKAALQVYQAKFHKDKKLINIYRKTDWIKPVQVGAALTPERIAGEVDSSGNNISLKNVNYCELTALYWLWKNKLKIPEENGENRYYGLFHYRRILDITEKDLYRFIENDVDVVLSFPTFHEPDIKEHHARYIKESDWEAMQQALFELYPQYIEIFPKIFEQQYLYNYNLIIAKKDVMREYCEWLFPILERVEELSVPKGWERADRYIGYLGENLMTLYFLCHKGDLNIYHTGRLMLL